MSAPRPGNSPLRSRPWDARTREAVDRWRQGHVLPPGPVFLGHGPGLGVSPVWISTPIGSTASGYSLLFEDSTTPHHAMVVSQGCDLVKETFPLATVVPVYDAADVLGDSQQTAVRAGMVWHLVHLTAPWAAGGVWVADLRHEMAIDKSLLLELDPIDAFSDEVGYARLAERLAAARQRPAMPQPSIDHVVVPLRRFLADQRAAGTVLLKGVREVRLQSNDAVAPTAVTLFVLAEDGEVPDEDGWSAAVDAVHGHAATAGIALTGPEITSLGEMSALDYLTSQAVADADSS